MTYELLKSSSLIISGPDHVVQDVAIYSSSSGCDLNFVPFCGQLAEWLKLFALLASHLGPCRHNYYFSSSFFSFRFLYYRLPMKHAFALFLMCYCSTID